jgi:hypothetical protein
MLFGAFHFTYVFHFRCWSLIAISVCSRSVFSGSYFKAQYYCAFARHSSAKTNLLSPPPRATLDVEIVFPWPTRLLVPLLSLPSRAHRWRWCGAIMIRCVYVPPKEFTHLRDGTTRLSGSGPYARPHRAHMWTRAGMMRASSAMLLTRCTREGSRGVQPLLGASSTVVLPNFVRQAWKPIVHHDEPEVHQRIGRRRPHFWPGYWQCKGRHVW